MATPSNFLTTASTNANVVQAGKCRLKTLVITGGVATAGHLKLYDKATAPAPAADAALVKAIIDVPASAGPIDMEDLDLDFASGLGFAYTGGQAANDSTNGPAGESITFGVETKSF